jgi:hypothetical protein
MQSWGWLPMDITTILVTWNSFICQKKDAFADCVEIFVEFGVMQVFLLNHCKMTLAASGIFLLAMSFYCLSGA